MKKLNLMLLFICFFSVISNAAEESARIDSVSSTVCKVSEEKSYCFMKIERIFDDPSTHSIAVCDKTDDEIYPCPKVTDCEKESVNENTARRELSSYTGDDNPPNCSQFKLRVRSGGGR